MGKAEKSTRSWLLLFLAIVIIIGVSCRWINLDRKPYWFDEVYTSFRAAGYTSQEIDRAIFQNRIIPASDLQRFQQIKPDSSFIDTVNSLKQEDPQHPPLYFVAARRWMQTFGSSIAASRSLPALISLFSLPAIYWLGIELFQSRMPAILVVVWLAISPVDILFAQTARQYSLLTLAVIGSSWLLLRSLRCQNLKSWIGYAVALTIGFYSHPLFVLTVIAQGLYVLIWSHWQQQGQSWFNWRTIRNAAGAMLVCGLLYSPWIYVLLENYQRAAATTGWTKSQVGLINLLKFWIFNITSVLVDLNLDIDDPLNYLLRLPALVVIGLAFYAICRYAPRKTWVFILLLVLVPFLLLALPDVIIGGKRSTVARYLIPCYPGIQLAVAYLMAATIQRGRQLGRIWRQTIWVILLLAAIASVISSTLATTWWSKSTSYFNGEVADYINAAPNPVVIGDRGNSYMNKGQLISISDRLQEDVKLLLMSHPPDLSVVPIDAEPLVYQPSGLLRRSMESAGWTLQPVFTSGGLWKAQHSGAK